MVYLIELSVNLHNAINLSNIQHLLVTKAEECNMETYYKTYEFMGNNRNIYRNHCIISFTFADDKKSIVSFIKYVKTLSNVYIESVGYDDFTYKMIYDGNQGKGYIKNNLSKTKKYVELDEHTIKSITRNQSSTKSIEDKLQSFISQKKSKTKTRKRRRKKRKKKYKRDTRKKIK